MRIMILSAAIASAMVMSGSALAQTVGIGTTKGGFTNQAGQAISKIVSQKTDLQMRAQPFGGSSVYVPAMNSNQIEFGLVNEFEGLMALTGTGIYEGRKHPNLRVATVLTPFRVGFWAKKGSPITSLKHLKGKRISSGFSSQKIIIPLIQAQLANAGLSYDDVTQVPAPNVVRAANDFSAGKTDGFFFVFGAGKVREVNAKVGGLQFLSFDNSAGGLERARKFVPPAFALGVKPSKQNVGVAAPSNVMTYFHSVMTQASVADDVVYKVVKAMHGNQPDLKKAFPGLGLFDPNKMVKKFKGLTYHPGAIKFYKEVGLWPPK